MQTRIQKWGNSLALRIPKIFASEVGLDDDALVELSLVDGKLIVAPLIDQPLTLASLLADITEENIHGETETGERMGNEVW